MSWKYKGTPVYETWMRQTDTENKDLGTDVAHFRASGFGEYILSARGAGGDWSKRIFSENGALVVFNSRFPGRYTRQKFDRDGGFDRTLRRGLGGDASVSSTLFKMMFGPWPGSLLANPHLTGLSLEEQDGLQLVTFALETGPGQVPDTMRVWIEPQTLVLRKTATRKTIFNGDRRDVTFQTETYDRARFDPAFGFDEFRTAAPLHYKLLDSFDGATKF